MEEDMDVMLTNQLTCWYMIKSVTEGRKEGNLCLPEEIVYVLCRVIVDKKLPPVSER